ncbi:MAG TPA: M15 family peptidase, partial [Mycobacterium sp.]
MTTTTAKRLAALTAVAATLVQCAPAPAPPSSSPATSTPTVGTSSPGSPETFSTVTRPPAPPRPQPASVHPVSAADLAATWRPGCPLPPDALRRIDLDYWGFDGRTHRGQLVVHQDLTAEVIAVFEQLLRLR